MKNPDELKELREMLIALRCNAVYASDTVTLINDVSYDSFIFVINKALSAITELEVKNNEICTAL